MEVYEKYLELLEKTGFSTYQVAKGTGIPETVFSKWKAREGKLSVDNLRKVAAFFGVPMEYFLEVEDAEVIS